MSSSVSKEPNMFVFATIMCLVCSILLTFAATALKERQDFNVQLDKQKNVLSAMGLYKDGVDVVTLYKESVQDMWVNSTGRLVKTSESDTDLPIYVHAESGQILSYAIPVSGYGLWSTIYGFLAIEGDGATVKGLAFYQHGETPGLGGEVEKDWFQDQFVGKSIVDESGNLVSVGVVKGKVADTIPVKKRKNYVDGISGATITSKGVEVFLKAGLLKYESFSRGLR